MTATDKATPRPLDARAVAVKPLKWVRADGSLISKGYGIIDYEITPFDLLFIGGKPVEKFWGDRAAAQAFAQADFDKRVRPALVEGPSTSTAGDEVQGMVDKADAWDAITEKNRRIAAFDKLVAKLEASVEELSEQNAALTARAEKAERSDRVRLHDNRHLRNLIAGTHKTAVKHTDCEKEFCPICEGGLFVCADCGAAEVEAEERICTASRALLAEAAEGLEPFSVIAGEYFAQNLNRNDIVASIKRPDGTRLDITAGHLFDARELVTKLKGAS